MNKPNDDKSSSPIVYTSTIFGIILCASLIILLVISTICITKLLNMSLLNNIKNDINQYVYGANILSDIITVSTVFLILFLLIFNISIKDPNSKALKSLYIYMIILFCVMVILSIISAILFGISYNKMEKSFIFIIKNRKDIVNYTKTCCYLSSGISVIYLIFIIMISFYLFNGHKNDNI